MANLWNKMMYHQGNGWWELPRTQWQEQSPEMEGPFGHGIVNIMNAWHKLTASGLLHGTPAFYTLIGAILGIITLVEVWAFNIQELGKMLVPLMLVLSLAKFILVVAFFMHLRFDRKYYAWVFGACMLLGVAMFIAILLLLNFGGQIRQ